MKKVGIITFHDSINYGALLQAFALQSYIKSLGYEVEIIDYKNNERKYSQVKGIKKIRSVIWKKTIHKLLVSKLREKRTNKFIAENLNLSKKTYANIDEINSNPPLYDFYITGSDQVWNPKNNNNDYAYWLSFAPNNKQIISYAPSFGLSKLTSEYLKECEKYVKRFDALSIRENEGKKILKESYGLEAEVVLDPTFLLGSKFWNNIVSINDKNDKYILCYYMPGDKIVTSKIKEIAEEISNKTGYKIINIGKKEYDKIKLWENNNFDCGPLEFLNLIKNADYVITNSFHGTAFSIIFNKTFWVPIHQSLDNSKALHSRITNLLSSLNLNSCIQNVDNEFYFDNRFSMNYEKTNKLLADLQIKSQNYLRKALEK